MTVEQAELVGRTFRHFKGNLYRLEGFAKDSETLEEMVVYRALYGEGGLWVRPTKMFFETVERDGRTMKRFELVVDEPRRIFARRSAAGSTTTLRMKTIGKSYGTLILEKSHLPSVFSRRAMNPSAFGSYRGHAASVPE